MNEQTETVRDAKGRFALIKDIRNCYACGSDTTYVDPKGHRRWFHNYPTNLVLCNRCYSNIIENPTRNPENWKRIFRFKNRRIMLNKAARTGKCQVCGKKIGDEYIDCKGNVRKIKRTHIDHVEYHEDDPFRDTVESCVSCHIRRHKNNF